ncbi:MAG: gluconokinase [Pseudomonadota bacterium]
MVKKFVLMGVAGSGKSTVGEALEASLGWVYVDGDHLHPRENIIKMERGIALTDEDRAPWLELVGRELAQTEATIAIGCSALKKTYRDMIRRGASADVCFIYLQGSRQLIEERMRARKGHFMPLTLLDSQFAVLEPPHEELAITIDISGDLEAIVEQITSGLARLG